MIERLEIESREQWLAMRQQDITASAAGALLGLHPYISAWSLWAEKTGLVSSDGDDEPGDGTRPRARADRHRAPAEAAPGLEGRRGPIAYYRDPEARLGATPDCLATDPAARPWRHPDQERRASAFEEEWFEDGEIRPPLWIAIQALIEAHLTGASWAAVAALVIGYGIDFT